MRRIVRCCLLLAIIFVLMQSCHKDVQTEMIKEITIDTTISANSNYFLNLAPFGNEDDIATILDKGNYFSISRLENETDMFTSVYHYSPSEANTGTDHVTLSISQNPAGRATVSKDSTIIYINFTIR